MAVHLVKLCVGIESVEALRRAQARRLAQTGQIVHRTRQTPRRSAELLDGGSLYWVIKGRILARQRLLEIVEEKDAEGRRLCILVLDSALIETEPSPHRPFQGWRYLREDQAPPDLAGEGAAVDQDIPEQMRAALTELALI